MQVASDSTHQAYQVKQSDHTKSSSRPTQSRHHVCLRHKLLGKCRFGDGCRYFHSEIPSSFELVRHLVQLCSVTWLSEKKFFIACSHRPAVEYILVPSSTSSSRLRTFLGKVDQSPEGKGFIAVESDRASGSSEVCV